MGESQSPEAARPAAGKLTVAEAETALAEVRRGLRGLVWFWPLTTALTWALGYFTLPPGTYFMVFATLVALGYTGASLVMARRLRKERRALESFLESDHAE